MKLINDFINLFFPDLCVTCGNSLWRHEYVICTKCDFHLPRTGFHKEHDNPVFENLSGRMQIENATSYFYFNKGSHVQSLIHQLKYKGRKDIGFRIGQLLGNDLIDSELYSGIDLIIPVPLHPKKQAKRGYNQSEELAKGISDRMKIPVDTHSLIRAKFTETQTRKSRFSRWENVSEIFCLTSPDDLAGKHLLLVDDVITTGSTIEACYQELIKAPGVRISIASIAAAIR